VLVSNNPYSFEPPRAPGTRPALDGGRLGVVVLDRPTTEPSLGGRWTATQLEVNGSAQIHAGIDGEAIDLDPPLLFAIRAGKLRVRISSGHASAWAQKHRSPPTVRSTGFDR